MSTSQKLKLLLTSNRSDLSQLPHYLPSNQELRRVEFESIESKLQESPRRFVLREAEFNVNQLFNKVEKGESDLVIAISVVAACGKRIIRSIQSNYDLTKVVSLLAGRRHNLYSGITIGFRSNNKVVTKSLLAETIIKIKKFSEREKLAVLNQNHDLIFYLDNILGAPFIHWIQGSYSNLNGSYSVELSKLLQANKLL